MSTQEIAIPTTVTTIDTVFAASALTYLVTLYVINTIINNMIKRKQILLKKTPTFFMNFFLFSFLNLDLDIFVILHFVLELSHPFLPL